MIRIITLSLLIVTSFCLLGQDDPVLFSVEGNPVLVSEFDYIYNKNNSDKADYSEESLEEYYGLYKNFKLKVQKARELKYDTIVALQNELEGYRKQLADAYLVDRKVIDHLVMEAFTRKKQDVEVAHILIKVAERATPAQETAAKEKIDEAYAKVKSGTAWENAVRIYSQDKNSKASAGYLGFHTAMLGKGLYELENSIYETPIGSFSEPVKSSLGWHIVKVISKRPAKGKVQVAHIMKRKDKKRSDLAKSKIDSIYQMLESGEDFSDLAKKFSDDKQSGANGGYLNGGVVINKYEKDFENAAFAIESNGAYSKPVETSIGWHIIKRINKPDLNNFKAAKKEIQSRIKRNERIQIAKKKLIDNIKKEGGLELNQKALSNYKLRLSEEFLTHKWKPLDIKDQTIMEFDDGTRYGTDDLSQHLKKNARARIKLRGNVNQQVAFDQLFDSFLEEKLIKYEESHLEEKYPEFKALMREYEEGILLFEVSKEYIWDKASQDSVGLEKFYSQNESKYMWDERARIIEYGVATTDMKVLKKLKKTLAKKSFEVAESKFNAGGKEILTKRMRIVNKDELPGGMAWKEGAVSSDVKDDKTSSISWTKLDKIIPPTPKTLQESRGFVIADYQEFLEKQWIHELTKEFKVDRNETVFKSLVK